MTATMTFRGALLGFVAQALLLADFADAFPARPTVPSPSRTRSLVLLVPPPLSCRSGHRVHALVEPTCSRARASIHPSKKSGGSSSTSSLSRLLHSSSSVGDLDQESTGGLLRRRKLADFLNTGHGNRQNLRQNAFAILAGLCLSFNSGYINGCCLSGVLKSCGTGVPVSAFTGAYTQAGLALGGGNVAGFVSNMKMILSFVAGSCLSGLINPRPVPNRVSPRYGPTFLVGSALLGASALLANIRPEGRAFLYLAAMANGLQNAVSSAYTANLIRSSHMSGITSDIGMFLGQMLRGNLANAWRYVVLSGLVSSFLLGGIVSYTAVTKFKALALVFNATFFFTIAAAIIAYTSYEQHVSVWRAMSGRWEWGDDGPPEEALLMELFDENDPNDTGTLDVDAFGAVMAGAGVKKLSDVGVGAVFRSLDKDGDGGVTREELLELVMCSVGPNGEKVDCRIVLPEENMAGA